jgi:hypothetical protein
MTRKDRKSHHKVLSYSKLSVLHMDDPLCQCAHICLGPTPTPPGKNVLHSLKVSDWPAGNINWGGDVFAALMLVQLTMLPVTQLNSTTHCHTCTGVNLLAEQALQVLVCAVLYQTSTRTNTCTNTNDDFGSTGSNQLWGQSVHAAFRSA